MCGTFIKHMDPHPPKMYVQEHEYYTSAPKHHNKLKKKTAIHIPIYICFAINSKDDDFAFLVMTNC